MHRFELRADSPAVNALLESPPYLDHTRKDAGFILGKHQGNMPVDRNLRLDELLCRGIHIAGISKREIVTHLLHNCNPRRRVTKRSDEVRIDLDCPGSEETLYAIGDGSVERASKQRVSHGVVSRLLLLLLRISRAFPLRVTQRQQCDDVGLG